VPTDSPAAHSAAAVAEILPEPRLRELRTLLQTAGFTEAAVSRRTGSESIYDFRSLREGRTEGISLTDGLDLLIRLFMDVELVDEEAFPRLLSSAALPLLREAGLVGASDVAPGRVHATVLLYPTQGLWIISDLNVDPSGRMDAPLSPDAVYPAITKNTRHFLSALPTTPCDEFLELCAGTGIAALRTARYARRAWAADITERSTRFARFNAALNGVANCEALQGDLYQPVRGRRFDRIAAHPPYMPSLEQTYVFRDGGEDGEQITRRVVAGLPDHLVPGGRAYCTCMLTDRRNAPAELRIREMLGPAAEAFDLVLAVYQVFQPTEYYLRLALAGRAPLEEVARRHEIFQRLEVEHLVYCSFVLERHEAPRRPVTARRQAGPATGAAEIAWLLEWEQTLARWDGDAEPLLGLVPATVPGIRLQTTSTLGGQGWTAGECLLATSTPFALEAKCPAWTPLLLDHADGARTTRDLLEVLKLDGAVPAGAPEGEFARFVRALLSGGFLRVEGTPPPDPSPS
jgi:SAM-dependent methyltransferase